MLVPQTGIVGAFGNLGGVIFALIFRVQPKPYGKAFWISGAVTVVSVLLTDESRDYLIMQIINLLLLPVQVPRA